MSYCTDIDVQNYYRRTQFSPTTKVTTAIANLVCNTISNQVDGKLFSYGVQVPIVIGTSPKAFARVKDLVIIGCVGFIEAIVCFGNQKTPSDEASMLQQLFENELTDILTNPVQLMDARFAVGFGNGLQVRNPSAMQDKVLNVPDAERNADIFSSEHIQDFVEQHRQITFSEHPAYQYDNEDDLI